MLFENRYNLEEEDKCDFCNNFNYSSDSNNNNYSNYFNNNYRNELPIQTQIQCPEYNDYNYNNYNFIYASTPVKQPKIVRFEDAENEKIMHEYFKQVFEDDITNNQYMDEDDNDFNDYQERYSITNNIYNKKQKGNNVFNININENNYDINTNNNLNNNDDKNNNKNIKKENKKDIKNNVNKNIDKNDEKKFKNEKIFKIVKIPKWQKNEESENLDFIGKKRGNYSKKYKFDWDKIKVPKEKHFHFDRKKHRIVFQRKHLKLIYSIVDLPYPYNFNKCFKLIKEHVGDKTTENYGRGKSFHIIMVGNEEKIVTLEAKRNLLHCPNVVNVRRTKPRPKKINKKNDHND